MKFIILSCMVAASFAAELGHHPHHNARTIEQENADRHAQILRQEIVPAEEDGRYSHDFETDNGIEISQSGSPGLEGAINSQGYFKIVHPDGQVTELKFVANENGFQPESAALPVAPAFPHEIPQFVLDQIQFAEEQKRLRALEEHN